MSFQWLSDLMFGVAALLCSADDPGCAINPLPAEEQVQIDQWVEKREEELRLLIEE